LTEKAMPGKISPWLTGKQPGMLQTVAQIIMMPTLWQKSFGH
jgi:hypothetical protein